MGQQESQKCHFTEYALIKQSLYKHACHNSTSAEALGVSSLSNLCSIFLECTSEETALHFLLYSGQNPNEKS